MEHLSFSYGEGRKNLEDISFTIYPGEMVSIVGKNGAGKSTLAKLICGFEHPQEGKIFFRGRDLASDTIKERASFIGYVMQNPNQMISKPMIWDEVEMALLQTGMTPEERKERVEETLKICGLYPFRKDFLECNLADKAIQTYTAICFRVSISRQGMIGAGSIIARTFRSQST